ncbi:PRELI domain-containing protein 2-like [Ruditapes philippinarum]|uniref:PRELI domain-containing protein 2-like n=1 Tax=Ruditapes philippinarum TaxID=129788 RepID=UPI00295AC132|nr:PRELI domain-containing protein 2-like [Ruditapes philippinarum]
MVVTIDIQHVYKYPLELVAHTHFTKYPTEKEKFVKRIDVIEEKTDSDGINYRKSIAICENVIPKLLRKIGVLNEKAILLEEESWFNVRRKQLHLKSRNLTWCKYANLWEKSVFRSHDENPAWTIFEQHGSIDVHGIGPFGRVIEMFAESFLHSGVKRSISIMEDSLDERYKEFLIQQS